MQLFKFNKEVGKRITRFDSNFVMNRILHTKSSVQIGCMHLEENGVIAYHQATVPQLLLITEGEGEVRGREDNFVKVLKGDAVFWEKDEWHETVSENGLVGIIIEGEDLKPSQYMQSSVEK